MLSIFGDIVEDFMEVFVDDFSVFESNFDNLQRVLKRCDEKNLVLNWEKCHFMVTQGIIPGYIFSAEGIQVDRAKINLISGLPVPKSVRDIRSFGACGFLYAFH